MATTLPLPLDPAELAAELHDRLKMAPSVLNDLPLLTETVRATLSTLTFRQAHADGYLSGPNPPILPTPFVDAAMTELDLTRAEQAAETRAFTDAISRGIRPTISPDLPAPTYTPPWSLAAEVLTLLSDAIDTHRIYDRGGHSLTADCLLQIVGDAQEALDRVISQQRSGALAQRSGSSYRGAHRAH